MPSPFNKQKNVKCDDINLRTSASHHSNRLENSFQEIDFLLVALR